MSAAEQSIKTKFEKFLDEVAPLTSGKSISNQLLAAMAVDDGERMTAILTDAESRTELLLSNGAIEQRRNTLLLLQRLITQEQTELANYPVEVAISPISLAIQRGLPKSIDALLHAGVELPSSFDFAHSRVWEQQHTIWTYYEMNHRGVAPDDWLYHCFVNDNANNNSRNILSIETRAKLLAYSDIDLVEFRRMFLALRQRTNTILRFADTRTVLEKAFLEQTLRKRAQMFALLEVKLRL